jgi:hypothetical protein
MLSAIRRHMTYANAAATLALVFSMSGGALAAQRYLTGSPSHRYEVLAAKHHKKGKKPHRPVGVRGPTGRTGVTGPTGQPGATGAKGEPGSRGELGPQGPGATTFTATLAESTQGTIATLANGVQLHASCVGGSVGIEIETTSKSFTLELSGTASKGSTAELFPINVNDTTSGILVLDTNEMDWDVIVRDSAVGKFARLDAHGEQGSPCKFWGMITPSN